MPSQTRPQTRRHHLRPAALLLAALLLLAGCGLSDELGGGDDEEVDDPGEPFLIVVTHAPLAALVRGAVGNSAQVDVLVPNGEDPRRHFPDTADLRKIEIADVVVANGGGLEPGFAEAFAARRELGQPTFVAVDHTGDRGPSPTAAESPPAAPDANPAQPNGRDPWFWLDPTAGAEVVTALGTTLQDAGLDVAANAEAYAELLRGLQSESEGILATIPADRRELVSNEPALGWLATSFALEYLGSVLPADPTASPSGEELQDLVEVMRERGVNVVFVAPGEPTTVLETVTAAAQAQAVDLAYRTVPDDGRYETFMRDVAGTVSSALSG